MTIRPSRALWGAAAFGLLFSLALASLGNIGTPPAVKRSSPQPVDSSRATDGSLGASPVMPAAVSASGGDAPPGTSGEWTFCSNLGQECRYSGLREVRLISVSGAAVTQTAYGSVACSVAGFQNRNPAPLSTMRCDYGPMKLTTLANPRPGVFGMSAAVTVPMGSPGASGQQVRPTSVVAGLTDGAGVFRTTCQPTGFRFTDLPRNPGGDAESALYVSFGNTAAGQNPVAGSIASRGNSSCRGGTLDRSFHTVPALVDS